MGVVTRGRDKVSSQSWWPLFKRYNDSTLLVPPELKDHNLSESRMPFPGFPAVRGTVAEWVTTSGLVRVEVRRFESLSSAAGHKKNK